MPDSRVTEASQPNLSSATRLGPGGFRAVQGRASPAKPAEHQSFVLFKRFSSKPILISPMPVHGIQRECRFQSCLQLVAIPVLVWDSRGS